MGGFKPVIKSIFASIDLIDDAKFQILYCIFFWKCLTGCGNAVLSKLNLHRVANNYVILTDRLSINHSVV